MHGGAIPFQQGAELLHSARRNNDSSDKKKPKSGMIESVSDESGLSDVTPHSMAH
jgi:hypothetical protein